MSDETKPAISSELKGLMPPWTVLDEATESKDAKRSELLVSLSQSWLSEDPVEAAAARVRCSAWLAAHPADSSVWYLRALFALRRGDHHLAAFDALECSALLQPRRAWQIDYCMAFAMLLAFGFDQATEFVDSALASAAEAGDLSGLKRIEQLAAHVRSEHAAEREQVPSPCCCVSVLRMLFPTILSSIVAGPVLNYLSSGASAGGAPVGGHAAHVAAAASHAVGAARREEQQSVLRRTPGQPSCAGVRSGPLLLLPAAVARVLRVRGFACGCIECCGCRVGDPFLICIP
jgi:hypothetical protein